MAVDLVLSVFVCSNGPSGGSGAYATRTVFAHCNHFTAGSSRYTLCAGGNGIALAVVTLTHTTAAVQKDVLPLYNLMIMAQVV